METTEDREPILPKVRPAVFSKEMRKNIQYARWGWMYYVSRSLWKYLIVPWMGIDVVGREHLAGNRQRTILVCKHGHHTDPFVIATYVPQAIHWVADENRFFVDKRTQSFYNRPMWLRIKRLHLGWFALFICWIKAVVNVFADKRAFTIMVDREKKDKRTNLVALAKIAHVLKEERVIGIFPEAGVWTKSPIEDSLFLAIAKRYRARIIPVNVKVSGKTHRIAFGEPITWPRLKELTNKDVMDIVSNT